MKKPCLILFIILPLAAFADGVTFIKTFGGSENDFSYSVQQTTDGGYIIAGQTASFGNGSGSKPDLWIIRLDKQGNKVWEKTFGGRESDIGFSIQQTSDEGYVVAGTTSSFGKGYPSIWILKLKSNGDTLWTRIYEGTMVSAAHSIRQTKEGGYIVAGKGQENILKLDKDGKKEWGKRYGWIFYSVDQTSDGGYILAGDSIYKQLEWDYIPSLSILKIDKDGNKVWSNPLGNSFLGRASSVRQTIDGGYIVAGDSIGLKTGYDHSHYLLVYKLSKDGRREWNYTGGEYSAAQSVGPTSDNGYIVSGNATDAGYGLDLLLIKLDKSGIKKWSKSYGSSNGWEYASSAVQTSDGGYIVAGQSDYSGAGRYDMWILKLDENGNGPGPTGIPDHDYDGSPGFSLLQNYPNPFSHSTTIPFQLSKPGLTTIKVYNISGEEIETIFNCHCPAGRFSIKWNPKDDLPAGVYFYQLKVGQSPETKSFVYLN